MTDDPTMTNGHDSALETPEEDEALLSLRAETAALKDQALRYAAEAENTRRRAEKDVNDARAYAIQKFARWSTRPKTGMIPWRGTSPSGWR